MTEEKPSFNSTGFSLKKEREKNPDYLNSNTVEMTLM
jgi:hypothetical protein